MADAEDDAPGRDGPIGEPAGGSAGMSGNASAEAERKVRADGPPGGERRGTSALDVAKSVGAAMIGVQSRKNRERDFAEGKPLHFVIGGVIGTLVFLLAIWLLVQYLIATG